MKRQNTQFPLTFVYSLAPDHGLFMKPYPERHISAKGVSQIHPPVSDVNFSSNISIPRVRVDIKKTEHDTTF